MKLSVDQALRRAAKLANEGNKSDAENIYREILQYYPANQRALAALKALQAPISAPSPQQESQAVIALYNQGRLREMVERAAALLPRYPNVALYDLTGVAYARLRQFEKAVASFDAALRLKADHAESYNNRGIALQHLNRLDEALASFNEALRLKPEFVEAHYNRGIALQDLRRSAEALASYDKALHIKPDYAEAHDNRGTALCELGWLDEAIASYDRALELRPDYFVAHYNRGNALRSLKRLDEAIASYDKVLQIAPDHVSALNNRANTLWEMGRSEEALASYDKAIALKPDFSEAYHNRGNVLLDMNRLEQAVASFDKALQIRPDYADAYNNRGIALQQLDRLDEAIESFNRALAIRPELAEAYYNRGAAAARMCDWKTTVHNINLSDRGLDERVPPFSALAATDDPAYHLRRARIWVKAKYPSGNRVAFSPRRGGGKLRIGYFSADFHEHATMALIARMLELHDKTRFEIHAFSYGIDRHDYMRRRLLDAVDAFHDVRALSDSAIAELARGQELDIALDLNGHSVAGRPGIFAPRAAPIQISYLGYPGSSGAEFIDYIIADKVVLPPASVEFFTEKVIWLPHSYQVNDNRRPVSTRRFERAQVGLPAHGFVFCCFNNNYKLSPAEFDIWMRLLSGVDGSVLWLLRDNRWAEVNLRSEAAVRGVDPNRLVFADRVPADDHIARHACADLFLDTFNYNAHTTASDALWAGLPIVTKLGRSFASRVAGSLLCTMGMSELVTGTPEAYEHLALELATSRSKLAPVRAKLAANRLTTPLFDTEQFTRQIERAYETAYQRFRDGLPPNHFDVN